LYPNPPPRIPPANPPIVLNHGVVLVPYLLSRYCPNFCPPYAPPYPPAAPVAVVIIAGTHPPIVPAVNGSVAIVLPIPATISPLR
jgi:hypothetical protein